jgi:heat-inducible transcriptional repressor
MAFLEEAGYIMRPHTSAGSVPTDKAYRYYVETMINDTSIPPDEQNTVLQAFREREKGLENWLKLTASLLAYLVQNMAIVTSPKNTRSRFKYLDLVAIEDYIALLILILYDTSIKKETLRLNNKLTQEELFGIAHKFNIAYSGLTAPEIMAAKVNLSLEEKMIVDRIVNAMAAEDKQEYNKPHLKGLSLILGQPEFSDSVMVLDFLQLLEKENWLEFLCHRDSFVENPAKNKVRVIIGKENREEILQDLSFVIGRYKTASEASGIVGVMGPRRMDYARAISSVNLLSTLLSNSIDRCMY